jgi:Golgi nucleoside diphosphatase
MKLKIKLSDKELYEIELNDVMTIQELNETLGKLNSISKIFSKDVFSLVNKSSNVEKVIRRRYRISREREWCDTREKIVELLKIRYHGTAEQKDELLKKLGISWDALTKALYYLAKRNNIQKIEYEVIQNVK